LIISEIDLPLTAVLNHLGTPYSKQRPDQPHTISEMTLLMDSGEPGRATATKQSHEHCFRLIVGGMGRANDTLSTRIYLCLPHLRHPAEKLVSTLAGSSLEVEAATPGHLSDVPIFHFTGETKASGDSSHQGFIKIGLGTAQLMIEVGNNDPAFPSARSNPTVETVEERHRVGTSRDADNNGH
jgi:hypothetical protein